VGTFPLTLGREPTCHVALRDAGISRQHCEIDRRSDGSFWLHDLESKNGTTLRGLRLETGGRLPLMKDGELGVGEHTLFRFRITGAALELEIARGLDRGLVVVASLEPMVVGPCTLAFSAGRPHLRAREPIVLNGGHAGLSVQIVSGDVIETNNFRLEVR
jgi:hypothetical protein